MVMAYFGAKEKNVFSGPITHLGIPFQPWMQWSIFSGLHFSFHLAEYGAEAVQK